MTDEVEPGALVAIGDRVLLRLGCGPMPGPTLGLVGGGRAMSELRRRIVTLARGGDSVLVLGETGTGKELVARAFHDLGPRRRAPFVALNCAAIPDTLVDAELFGYVKGAFTGAATAREGLFLAARDGTIFLDEVGELSLAAQAKLLRVLQERRLRPVGSMEEVPFHASLVMATHRDLEDEVARGRFRADLYARIEAPVVSLPAVRERREDVPRLFVHFLASHLAGDPPPEATPFRAAGVHAPSISMQSFLQMMSYDWLRNVREIQKLSARVAMDLRVHGAADERAFPRAHRRASVRREPARRHPPNASELLELLDGHDFVQNRLAKTLGVSRTTLDKWIREAGIRRPSEVEKDEIIAALERNAGDAAAAARELRVSKRGLRLRARELAIVTPGVPPD